MAAHLCHLSAPKPSCEVDALTVRTKTNANLAGVQARAHCGYDMYTYLKSFQVVDQADPEIT